MERKAITRVNEKALYLFFVLLTVIFWTLVFQLWIILIEFSVPLEQWNESKQVVVNAMKS